MDFVVEEWTVSVPGDMDFQQLPIKDVWLNPEFILRGFYKVSGIFSENAIFSKIAVKPPSSKNRTIWYLSDLVHHASYMQTEICWKTTIQNAICPKIACLTLFSKKKIAWLSIYFKCCKDNLYKQAINLNTKNLKTIPYNQKKNAK